jgi:hypothetical protein
MPVLLVTPVAPPAPVFTGVHLESLMVSLERTEYANAALKARLRLYYLDGKGCKVFDEKFYDVELQDVEKWVTEKAMAGDMRGVAAMTNIKEIVAFLTEEAGLGAAVVS